MRAANGVSLTVPRGVMRRDGRVSISLVGSAYDIHIAAPWRGRVIVRMPLTDGLPVIAHRKAGRWILEDAVRSGGMAVASVTSLSVFKTLACLARLRPTAGSAVTVVRCLVQANIDKIPEWIAKRIVKYFNTYDPCRPVSLSNWSIDWLEILLSACRLGDGAPPAPAPAPVPAPPAPAPAPPAPAPAPAPAPVSAWIVVNTCNTYGNCDYWNPVWIHGSPAVSSRIADAWRGMGLTARCWANGRVLTDGSNNTAEDDARQFTSGLWYALDWNGGRGFIPAVWTTKRADHLGLPGC